MIAAADNTTPEALSLEAHMMAHGPWWQVQAIRTYRWLLMVASLLIIAPTLVALMLLGICLSRSGLLARAGDRDPERNRSG